MSDDELDLVMVRAVLGDLQRDFREDPFFAELFATRATGFLAATGSVRAEEFSAVSAEAMAWSWQGLCELLGVPTSSRVDDLEELLDRSDRYPG